MLVSCNRSGLRNHKDLNQLLPPKFSPITTPIHLSEGPIKQHLGSFWGIIGWDPHVCKGHFTHKTESPWPSHFKHSHWWKKQSPSKFASKFTLHLRDQRSMWMQDGYQVHMDSYMAWNGSCFMVTWTIFQKPPLEGSRSNIKPRIHSTPSAHNRLFILY
jgi:hypothetical protein